MNGVLFYFFYSTKHSILVVPLFLNFVRQNSKIKNYVIFFYVVPWSGHKTMTVYVSFVYVGNIFAH